MVPNGIWTRSYAVPLAHFASFPASLYSMRLKLIMPLSRALPYGQHHGEYHFFLP